MVNVTRLEYFAGLAMQGMITLMRGSSTTDAMLAKRAFEVAQAMDAEAAKHNPDDLAQARGMLEAEEFAKQLTGQHGEAVSFGGALLNAMQPPS